MASCVIKPTIKVGNEERESKLFSDLLSFTGNRDSAQIIWALSQVPDIMKGLNVNRDENGEPTLESLDKALNIKSLLDNNLSLLGEKISLGATDSKGNNIVHKRPELIIDKVIKFNESNPALVADVSKNEEGYVISVEEKNNSNSDSPARLMFNNSLNNKLLGIMRSLGFDVSINSTMSYNGMFNPLDARPTAEGLRAVIQIAKGQRGEDAFPEEFSHFIIEGLTQLPLVSRLLESLRNPRAVEEVLGDSYNKYRELYGNDFYMLQKEAAAKLLQQHIVEGKAITRESFVDRIWNFVKGLFSKLNEQSIDDAINEANQGAAKLASMVIDESILPLVDKDAILGGKPMYSVGAEINKLENLANRALEVASRRLRILMLRSKSGKYSEEDSKSVKNLQYLIDKKKYSKSCLAFLTDSLSQIEQLDRQLKSIKSSDVRRDSDLSKIKRVSSLLRNIKDFSEGYAPIIEDMITIKAMQERGEIDLTEEDAELISQKASDVFRIVKNINSQYQSLRYNTVYNFLKLYWGEDKVIDVGHNKGKQLTLNMIMDMADKDINGVDRWISSMGDSSDALLSLIDKAVKVSHSNRDNLLVDVMNDLRGAQKKLQDAGHTSEFMFERDKDGNLTGRIISNIDFIKFNKERKEYLEKLKKEGLEGYKIKTRIEKWEADRTEVIVINEETGRKERVPSKSLYSSNALDSLDSAQREYYNSMLKAKSLLDDLLPTRFTNTYRAIQIRNDMTEVIFNNITDPKKASKLAIENLKDKFLRRSDDTEFGGDEISNLFTTFSGKPIDRLPIYYTTELEDMSRLSTDFTSSMLAYAGMAINYSEMNKIIDALELTKDLAMDREVQQYSGDKKLVESFKVLHKKFSKSYSVSGSQSNIGDKLEDYFQSVIYGRSKKDQGTIIGNVDTAKTLDTLRSYTGVIGLGLNLFSAIGNITAGKMQMFIESIGGEYFNYKNMAIGKKNYWAMMPEYMAELNSIKKTNKMALLIDKFDALEEFHSNFRNTNYYKGPLTRIIGSANLYFLNNLGEHYLHTRNMLSILDAYKVKDSSGRELSLFDAFEVVDTKDDKGNSISSSIKLKDGITKLDGSEITNEDFTDLKLKIGKVNQSLNGAFNEDDKGAIHRNAYGRLAMQFRQWMPAHYGRRFDKARYDARLGQWREGYYRTAFNFGLELLKDARRAKFDIATHWNELSQHEKANLRRSLSEMGMFAALSVLISMLGAPEDRKGVWHDRMILYSLNRMKLETGASMPLNSEFLTNIWTLLQSPAAALKQIDNLTNLVRFDKMFNEIESGRYKGWSEYEADLVKTLPIYGQIRKVVDIENESYMFNIFNR